MSVAVVVTDITCALGGRPVLTRASLEVQCGERVALVGPSGSGKTTLLSIIGGLRQADSGDVRWAIGSPVDTVAWVLQTTNAFASRTVLDNAAIGAVISGVSRLDAEAAARHWLAMMGLEGLSDQPARTLSGGELQRLSIARALASGRGVVMADEPTGQLDAGTSAAVSDVLMASGRTICIATHDRSLARRCDRVLQLRDGVVVAG